ncbi:universal stress protein [Agrilutibacter solisilvae]|uniref:Universal stress protein n=1 Tax=Agrilutibacter solisilvae TaxID=2763317 RepID=A0A974Y4H0_9GAMM|nr:universal stress protein [Lysobacter solisilvae]QSX77776.1 universal stress protein [Lysobacter solisilvae]
MIHDLTLAVTGTTGDRNALAAAVALAAQHKAHLTAVQPLELPVPLPAPWDTAPVTVEHEICNARRAEANQRAERLRDELSLQAISSEVRVAEARYIDAPLAVALLARHADLGVVAAPVQNADDGAIARAFIGSLLFESGRPVLVVPAHHAIELPLQHAVVAWKPTREATRAVHDALPLLNPAATIDVVVVDPRSGEPDQGEEPGCDIAGHLARHGFKVNVVTLKRGHDTVATTLLRHAAQSNARMLVAGGYGHSRMREWALGGTTRELLQAMHLPILFSH